MKLGQIAKIINNLVDAWGSETDVLLREESSRDGTVDTLLRTLEMVGYHKDEYGEEITLGINIKNKEERPWLENLEIL